MLIYQMFSVGHLCKHLSLNDLVFLSILSLLSVTNFDVSSLACFQASLGRSSGYYMINTQVTILPKIPGQLG